MRYIAAYMLATMGGNESPCVADIERILGSVGIECDEVRCQQLIDELSKRPLEEILEAGEEKLATVPMGGGVPIVEYAATDDVAAKIEVEEIESSDEENMGFGLFDD